MSARRTIAIVAALGVALACTGRARAAGLPDRGWSNIGIGVLPGNAYLRTSGDLFAPSPEDRALADAWRRVVLAALSDLEQTLVVDTPAVLARLGKARDYGSRHKLGRTYQKLGLERFEAVNQAGALELFDQALDALRGVHADTVDPKRVADIQFYRGLALLEAGRSDAAHVALREMFLLDPGRTFQRGYYGAKVEAALAGALADLRSQPDTPRLRYTVERLVDLGRRARVAVWVIVDVGGDRASPTLRLTMFDVRSRGIVLAEKVALPNATPPSSEGQVPDAVADTMSRLLSAWHTCHVEARVDTGFTRAPRRLGVFVEVGYTHSLMLEHDTRALFHSPGAFIDVTWELSENLLVFVRTVQMVSLPDPNQDLLESFVTSRLAAGLGLSGGSRDIRGTVTAGVEAGFAFNDIRLSQDADCKHFGENDARCSGVTTFAAPGVWFGFVIGAGLRWRMIQTWYLRAAVDISMYVADTRLVDDLNFPLSLSLGIGNRF